MTKFKIGDKVRRVGVEGVVSRIITDWDGTRCELDNGDSFSEAVLEAVEVKRKFAPGDLVRTEWGSHWLIGELNGGVLRAAASNEHGDVLGGFIPYSDLDGTIVTPKRRTKTISLYGPTGSFEKTMEVPVRVCRDEVKVPVLRPPSAVPSSQRRPQVAIYRRRYGTDGVFDFTEVTS